jgi:hypothetical protein
MKTIAQIAPTHNQVAISIRTRKLTVASFPGS